MSGKKISGDRKGKDHPGRRKLRTRLIHAQFDFHQRRDHALVVIMGGFLSADRADAVDRLLDWMDPRNIRVYALEPDSGRGDEAEDKLRPPQGRYWRRLPARGTIAVFHGGWYADALDPNGKPLKADKLHDLRRLEAMLLAERVQVLKIWLDRPPAGLKDRVTSLKSDAATAWRVTPRDQRVMAALAPYRKKIGGVLTASAADGGIPWHRLTLDHNERVWEDLAERLMDAISHPPTPPPLSPLPAMVKVTPPTLPPPSEPLEKIDYRESLAYWQGELHRLTRSAAFRKRALVVAFEGFDAAGKGGTIRRLSRGVDPHQLNVVPIAAPTETDRLHPYLWRFWRHVPALSEVVIFDRTWYGRVLVERVEGFANKNDWHRAYEEIRDFEAELAHHGVVVVKIWLDVSEKEQLKRFEHRAKVPYKRYKLTDDDWRNAKLRPAYEKAAAEMFARTHADHAPWVIIPSDDKTFARIATVRHVAQTLAAHLGVET